MDRDEFLDNPVFRALSSLKAESQTPIEVTTADGIVLSNDGGYVEGINFSEVEAGVYLVSGTEQERTLLVHNDGKVQSFGPPNYDNHYVQRSGRASGLEYKGDLDLESLGRV